MMFQDRVVVRETNGATIRVEGNITALNASAFARILEHDVAALALNGGVELDRDELELEDGAAVAEAINGIRALLKLGRVIVRHAPQMLAHTLYKTGMLENAGLELIAPRGDAAPTLM